MSAVGHVPFRGACMACGVTEEQVAAVGFEPCPEQEKARALLAEGYMAVPASDDEYDGLRAAVDVAVQGRVRGRG